MNDWQKLEVVHILAKEAGVSYSLNRCESDDTFYFTVDSPAKSENWIGKNYSFDIAVECVIEWLNSILHIEIQGQA